MAMAMAAAAGAVGVGARLVAVSAATPTRRSSGGRVSQLCSSFTGLSISNWKKTLNGGEMRSSLASPPAIVKCPVGCPVAKVKTHKASAKRFKVTGSGKIVRRQAGRAHLLRKKTTKRKNRLSGKVQVNRSDYDNVIGALPYLKVSRSA